MEETARAEATAAETVEWVTAAARTGTDRAGHETDSNMEGTAGNSVVPVLRGETTAAGRRNDLRIDPTTPSKAARIFAENMHTSGVPLTDVQRMMNSVRSMMISQSLIGQNRLVRCSSTQSTPYITDQRVSGLWPNRRHEVPRTTTGLSNHDQYNGPARLWATNERPIDDQ